MQEGNGKSEKKGLTIGYAVTCIIGILFFGFWLYWVLFPTIYALLFSA